MFAPAASGAASFNGTGLLGPPLLVHFIQPSFPVFHLGKTPLSGLMLRHDIGVTGIADSLQKIRRNIVTTSLQRTYIAVAVAKYPDLSIAKTSSSVSNPSGGRFFSYSVLFQTTIEQLAALDAIRKSKTCRHIYYFLSKSFPRFNVPVFTVVFA
jgi:hypothetical protein